MQPTPASRELSLQDIAARSGDSLRTVQARCSSWFGRQHDQTVPRVRREYAPGMARWEYRVDADSYEAFVLGELKADALPPCATEASRLLGCTCERIPLAGKWGVVVPDDCPVHASLAKAS